MKTLELTIEEYKKGLDNGILEKIKPNVYKLYKLCGRTELVVLDISLPF